MPEQDPQSAPVKLPLFSAAQERTGEAEFAAAVFGRESDQGLLHDAVRMQLANRRSGTAATKTRGLISGGGRNPLAAVASRRDYLRAAAARLLLPDTTEGMAPRAVSGTVGAGSRGQTF